MLSIFYRLIYLYTIVTILAKSTPIDYPQCTCAYRTFNLASCVYMPDAFDQQLISHPERYKCKINEGLYSITMRIHCTLRNMIFKGLRYEPNDNDIINVTSAHIQTPVIFKIVHFSTDGQSIHKVHQFYNEVKSMSIISDIEAASYQNTTSPSQYMLKILDYAPKLPFDNRISNSIIVLEHMPLGSIFHFFKKQKSLSKFASANTSTCIQLQSRQVFKQFKQNPIKYTAQFIKDMSIILHATNVEAHWIHRDIKMENVFIQVIDANNMSDIKIRFVLGSWELSTPINQLLPSSSVSNPVIFASTMFMSSPEMCQLKFRYEDYKNSNESLVNTTLNIASVETSIDAYNTVCLYVHELVC